MARLSRGQATPQILWLKAGLTAGVYLAAGFALIALGGWDIYADALVQGEALWTTLLENTTTIAIGLALAGTGAWVSSRPTPLEVAALARWTAVTVLFVVGITGIVMGTQALQSVWKPWIMYANFAGGILLAGFASALFASRLERKAFYDPLTDLPNRNLLVKQLKTGMQAADRAGRQMALLHLGLDNFKDVNEGFGQVEGDQLLRVVARRLAETLGPEQTLARLAGDEFAIVVPELADRESAGETAEALKHKVLEAVQLGGRVVRIQASIGIAQYPEDADAPEELLRCADSALRYGKRSGGNQWAFYDKTFIREAANRVVVGGRLRNALNQGEIWVAYQPIVRLTDHAVIGYEALARWHHPQEGWIPPDRFIPVAEHNGLIEEIGSYVARQACAKIADAQPGTGQPLFVSVNVSPLQIHRPDIVQTLHDICAQAGVKPAQLVIEVTEQAMLGLDTTTLNRLETLRQAGFAVAIDDFGTGYASLSYLKHLPADRIKLDRKFVNEVDGDRGNQAIVAATLTLAREFELKQTAEGVETQNEAEKLRQMGYNSAQGFFFGKPQVAKAGNMAGAATA